MGIIGLYVYYGDNCDFEMGWATQIHGYITETNVIQ